MIHPDCHCPRAEHHHGTAATYRAHACRCDDCRAAATREQTAYRRRRVIAAWNPDRASHLDAQPIREHVLNLLDSGWSLHALSEASGITRPALRNLYSPHLQHKGDRVKQLPPTQRVTRRTAEALLAIKPKSAPRYVPAIGIARRLQALAHLGWTTLELARLLGTNTNSLGVYNPERNTTPKRVAQVDRLYRHLLGQPTRTGGNANKARTFARRNGWPPPWAWDNRTIDDPNAGPLPYELRTAA